MAGHSKFKNIMHRKGAQDKKRAKMFTKVVREIISATKSGMPDPASNPRLRSAIQWARSENLPNDKIEAAIKRGSGDTDGDNYEEMRYEGYGPGGVAVIVQALTDNRNRSASDIRAIFSKHGGSLGETGSVSFMFNQSGVIEYPASVASDEAMFEAALEHGAGGCESDTELHTITCEREAFGDVQTGLEKQFGEPKSAKLAWLASTTSPLDHDGAEKLMRLVDALEDNDDVQEVFTNADIPDEVLEKLSA